MMTQLWVVGSWIYCIKTSVKYIALYTKYIKYIYITLKCINSMYAIFQIKGAGRICLKKTLKD